MSSTLVAYDVNAKLTEYHITLPKAPDPVGIYVAAKRVGNLIYINQVA